MSLPGPEFASLIRQYTGDVGHVRPSELGTMSDLTALVECEAGPFFIKAVRNKPGGRRDSLVRERLINPHVRPLSPSLLWHTQDDDWIALGFEVVEGRPADFGRNSPELPGIVDALNQIADLPLPEIALDWTETRWDSYANPQDLEHFRGDALLHADINIFNLMVGDALWVVDWAWPTRGAAFIEPALFAVQLIAEGHTADSAESWAAGCVSWVDADPEAIDAFALANQRMWDDLSGRAPDRRWMKTMAGAAHEWTAHRGLG
ncbi:hypothetical protein GCM10022254_46550 [Actinomadura meridiana]|uniref:Protein kinase n=2 Tax=Actinomadura meridiana TaxID=559626 RepID=A0ABP8CAD1_9ACTN